MTDVQPLRALTLAAAVLMTLALGGCRSLPPLRYYTLDAVDPPSATPSPDALLVRIRHVGVPHEMDHLGLTHRAGATQLAVSDHDQWSAPLNVLIQATMIRDLGARLGYEHVLAADALPVPASSAPDHSITVDLDFVSLVADDRCSLTAEVNWTVSAANTPARRGTAKLASGASGCPAGLPLALSSALGTLADQLIPSLITLPASPQR